MDGTGRGVAPLEAPRASAPNVCQRRERRPLTLSTTDLNIPMSRRQNIITNPATAANTEAMGINVSGPMYTWLALRECCESQDEHPHLPARFWTRNASPRHALSYSSTLPQCSGCTVLAQFPFRSVRRTVAQAKGRVARKSPGQTAET